VPEIIKLTGSELTDWTDELARLRIDAFREFPYLYEGSMDYERNYLKAYGTHQNALLLVLMQDNIICGMSSGMPLNTDSEIVATLRMAMCAQDYPVGDFFYFSETILTTAFQSQGWYSKLTKRRAAIVTSWGFHWGCFLTVHREADHPLRPPDYQGPFNKFEHLGYKRTPLTITYEWPTIESASTSRVKANRMDLWIKRL
jgi:hypothetical protein